ncbi:hypothetical protein LSAT2_002977 [Lamellibrachia satsuma]|nr:hypothetical protein LSAT2_002977 [Lamellibrachia satsuma]
MSRRDTIACTRWWRRAATYRSHAGNTHSIHRLVGYCVLVTCGRCVEFLQHIFKNLTGASFSDRHGTAI